EQLRGAQSVAQAVVETEGDERPIDRQLAAQTTHRVGVTDERVSLAQPFEERAKRLLLIGEHVMEIEEVHARTVEVRFGIEEPEHVERGAPNDVARGDGPRLMRTHFGKFGEELHAMERRYSRRHSSNIVSAKRRPALRRPRR